MKAWLTPANLIALGSVIAAFSIEAETSVVGDVHDTAYLLDAEGMLRTQLCMTSEPMINTRTAVVTTDDEPVRSETRFLCPGSQRCVGNDVLFEAGPRPASVGYS